jgi:hypothetical protein
MTYGRRVIQVSWLFHSLRLQMIDVNYIDRSLQSRNNILPIIIGTVAGDLIAFLR